MRNAFRILIRRRRAAAAARTCVGETDLYTLEPIPTRHQVRVLDLLQKRTYIFHYATLEKNVQAALSYATYGFADPLMPKNPYTNLPWTLGQCITIFQQIGRIRTECHRFMPEDIVEFAKAHYRPAQYLANRHMLLHIRAAEAYFSDLAQPDVLYDYAEALDELYDVYMLVRPEHASTVRRLVMKRMFPPDYMQHWDTLLVSFWIWRNHSIWHVRGGSGGAWTSLNGLLGAVEAHHYKSLSWWRTAPRHIVSRPEDAAPVAAPVEV